MKVLQIVKTSDGAYWAYEQAKYLKNKGVDIVTVLPDLKGNVAKLYQQSKMKIIESDFSIPISKPLKIFERKKIIKRIVDLENPDIIHCHFFTNIIMLRWSLKKTKYKRVFQVPGPLHLENKIFKMIDIKSSNENDYYIPTCNYSHNILKNSGIDTNKIFLNYYGGYGGKKCDEYSNDGVLRKELNIDKDIIIVGMISYIYKPKRYLFQKRGIKGHEDFIDAIELITKKYDNVVGVIIGGAWGNSQKYEKKVHKYANKKCKNKIIFTGTRNDIKSIYKDLDIVVHPSHSENLGGAAESLAAGVPTIATNIGGFPDIVVDNVTGYLCKPKNPQSIAECIEKMINNKEQTKLMASKGTTKVKTMLDIETTCKKLLEVYYKILIKEN